MLIFPHDRTKQDSLARLLARLHWLKTRKYVPEFNHSDTCRQYRIKWVLATMNGKNDNAAEEAVHETTTDNDNNRHSDKTTPGSSGETTPDRETPPPTTHKHKLNTQLATRGKSKSHFGRFLSI